jgi:AraC-like DNA-binding protein
MLLTIQHLKWNCLLFRATEFHMSINNASVPMQRVGPLTSVPVLLAEFGVPVRDALVGLEISAEALALPDHLIPFSQVGALLENCSRLTGCRHFGLLLGARNDHRAMGAIGALMSHAPTLGQAILDLVGNQIRYSRAAVVYLARHSDSAIFGYGIYDRNAPGREQIHDLVLAVGVNILRSLSGPQAKPSEILVAHRPPENKRPYLDLLGVPILFDQYQSGLVLSPALLQLPVTGAQPLERQRIGAMVDQLVHAGYPDICSRVRHMLRPLLILGDLSKQSIAVRLGIAERTLNRRLQEKGATLRQLLEEVRYAAACELLEITDLPVSDVASALSYSTHSSFVHAFQRWSTMSPSDWRARQRA